MAPSEKDFTDLTSAIGNLAGKIATQNDVLNNGPTSADFQSLTAALSDKLIDATTNQTDAVKNQTSSTKDNNDTIKKNTDSNKSLAATMGSLGKNLEKLGASLNKTQNDFGISLASAAKLQVTAFKDSINSFVKLFTSIDFSQLFSEIGEVGSAMADMAVNVAKDFASGKGVANAFTEGGKKIGEVLTKERPGPKIEQFVSPTQIKEATKKFQEQFGVINTEMGTQIATEAKNRGLSVDQLVEARRVFATTAMGDLNKVASIQNRFFDQFQSKGMTPKIALEAITKYAELIARNGNRFADSFARAAADAKKIGVDLSKVDQIGDSIISDFEGFLEKSAELGAMGFNLDSNTLAQLAESGDTGALFNELRSQLAATGKDITKLRRSEQLALSGAFGLSMSDIQRLAGGTPEATSMEDYAEEGNSLLGKILVLLLAAGPIASAFKTGFDAIKTPVGMLFDLAGWLGPKGWLAIAIAGIAITIADYMDSKVTKASKESDAFAEQAIAAYKSGNIKEGDRLKELSMNRELQASVLSSGDGFGVGLTRSPIQEKRIKAMQDARNTAAGTPTVPPPPPKPQSWFDKLFDIDFTPRTPPVKKAAGGLVTGPGTGKSDSIPTRLSNGEFVINADMVKKLGLPFLNQINSGTVKDTAIKALGSRVLAKLPGVTSVATKIAKPIPVVGSAIGGVLDGYGEYKKSNSVLRGVGKGLSSTAGGLLGNFLGGAGGTLAGGPLGGVVGSATGGITGSGIANKLFDKFIPQGLTGNLLGKVSGMFGGNAGKAMSGISNLFTGGGGLKGLADSLLGKVGLGSLGGSLLGGPMGMLGSLAAPYLKKIPFVGGTLASIAGGPGKLMGSALSKIGGLFGKKKGGMNLSSMIPPNMMQSISGMGPMAEGVNFPAMLAQMMGGQQPQQMPTAPVTVDTSGMEQKLNNFITALQGIQINMDGAQVGKVLVNYSDTAGTTGILRPRSNATF